MTATVIGLHVSAGSPCWRSWSRGTTASARRRSAPGSASPPTRSAPARLRRRPHQRHRQHHAEADGRRQAPAVSVGFFFSLGHSSVVFLLSLLLASASARSSARCATARPACTSSPTVVGTGVSGVFLYLIAAINIVVLVGHPQGLQGSRRGRFDETSPREHLNERGFVNEVLQEADRLHPHAAADVRGRAAVRPRLRHRHGGRVPRPRGYRRGERPALVRDLVPAGAVRGRA